MEKVTLKEDFTYFKNGCWPVFYKSGAVEMDKEALEQAKAAGAIETKGKEK